MRIKSTLSIAAALAFGASAAVAGHHEGDKKDNKMDWQTKLEQKFNEIDANGDGNVSSEEYMSYKTAEAEKEWAKWAEASGDDDTVSLEEAKAHYEAKMEKMKKESKDMKHMDQDQ